MRQRSYGRDPALTSRMILTIVLLAVVYVAFISLLFWAGISPIFIGVLAVIMVAFQYFFSDKLVLMSTGARTVTPQQEPKLYSMVERLAQMSDLPMPKKLAVMDSPMPNAFATGRNPKNAVVCVTTGLMNRLNDREVEAVLAHELSHIKSRDVMVLTWAGIIVIMAGYLMNMLFWMGLFGGFGGRGRNRDANQAAIVILFVYLGTIVIYFVSQLLILALSRQREYSADRGAAVITGAPLQLASALNKISDESYRIPEKDLRQVRTANAFMIVPAVKGSTVAGLFSSHPPVEKRIERLQMMQRQMERRF